MNPHKFGTSYIQSLSLFHPAKTDAVPAIIMMVISKATGIFLLKSNATNTPENAAREPGDKSFYPAMIR